jgi:hypothetical protein
MKLSARELELKAMREAEYDRQQELLADARNARNAETARNDASNEAGRNANAERQARWRAAQRAKREAERVKGAA